MKRLYMYKSRTTTPSGLDVKQSPDAQDTFLANTRPHQLCWGDRECGYHTSCTCSTDVQCTCVPSVSGLLVGAVSFEGLPYEGAVFPRA